MDNKKRKQLEQELQLIENQIEDLRLEDGLDVRRLKELVKQREQLKRRLEVGQE